MRDRHRQVLTGWQLFCLLVSSIVGTGVYSLARDVAEPAGAGGILSILLVGILMVISLLSLHLLASRFPGQTLNEYSGQILGPLLAKVYLLVYSFMSLGIAVSIPRAHFPVVSAWALGQTPQLVYILPFVLVCWNAAKRGAVVIARVVELLCYGTLPLMLLLMIPAVPFDPDFVRPILEKGMVGIIKGTLPALYSFAGFDIFLIVYPYVRAKRKFWIGAAGLGFVTLFYAVTTILIIGNLGLEFTLMSTWPLQSYLNRFALAVFERADVVFLIAWTFRIIDTTITVMYVAMSCLQGAFPRLKTGIVNFTILVLALAGGSYPVYSVLEAQIIGTYSLVAVAFLLLTPWLLWLIAVIRGKRGERSDEEKSAA